MVGLLSPGVQTGYNFAGNLLQYGRTKTFLAHFVALNGIRVILKKMSPISALFKELTLKKKESYQMIVEERYTTSRAKIEQINLRVKRDS